MGFVTTNCPNCGAQIELNDTQEYGFCSYCGAKIVQDKIVVEHKGSVKVDNSELVQKHLQNGRRAYAKDDWEEVEKYYNLVEQNDPDNIEAVFFSAFGKAMLSLTDDKYFEREQKFNVLKKSISIISDCYETTTEDKDEVIKKINGSIRKMKGTEYVYRVELKSGFDVAYGVGCKAWCEELINSVEPAFVNELEEILQRHDNPLIKDLLKEKQEEARLDEARIKAQKAKKKGNKFLIEYSIIGLIFGIWVGIKDGKIFFWIGILLFIAIGLIGKFKIEKRENNNNK